jgi:hypothetical protein
MNKKICTCFLSLGIFISYVSALELPAACSMFTTGTKLSPGQVHADVKNLQTLLNRDADTQVSEEGPGSPGNETTRYGVATKAAVVRFQEKYWEDILEPAGYTEGTGLFGSYTRKKMQALYCSQEALLGMKPMGSITFSSSTCTIPTNAKTCEIQVSWSSKNTTSPSITQLGISFSKLAKSPYISRTIQFGSTLFTLEDAGVPLSNKTAKATCEKGSTFDGSICKPSGSSVAKATGVIFFATPTCTIPKNARTCDVQVSWSSSNTSSVSVTQGGSKFSSLPTSPYLNRTIQFGSTLFTLENAGTPLSNKTAKATCEKGSTFDGSICKPSGSSVAKATGVIFFATPTCTIPNNARTCDIQVSWSTSNTTSVTVTQAGTKFSTLPTSPYMTRTISYGQTLFTISDTYTLLKNVTAKAVCETGSVWNGNICIISGGIQASTTYQP